MARRKTLTKIQELKKNGIDIYNLLNIREKVIALYLLHKKYVNENGDYIEPYSGLAYLQITMKQFGNMYNQVSEDEKLTAEEKSNLENKLTLMRYDLIGSLNRMGMTKTPPKNLDTLITMLDPTYNSKERTNFADLININVLQYPVDIAEYRKRVKEVQDGKRKEFNHGEDIIQQEMDKEASK